MTFEAFDSGTRPGRKVYLYVWQRGEKVWRYTSADRKLVINTQEYTPAPITHPDIEQGSEIVRMNVEVDVPYNHAVARMYRIQAPTDSVVLTISATYIEDPDTEVRPQWSGAIVGVSWDLTDLTASITHAPTFTSLQRMGLRGRCQSSCDLVLYGRRCGVSRESFKLVTVAAAVGVTSLTAPGISLVPDGYYSGGFIEYRPEVGVVERLGITSHVSGTVNLLGRTLGLLPGMAVEVFPGCDHTPGPNGCAKFNNMPNYGGFPFFARKNPFGNSPIF